MRYRTEWINGHEYIVGEDNKRYPAICGGDDNPSPSPLPTCPSHKKDLVFLNDSRVLLAMGDKLRIMYCPEVKCNYVYIPDLERNVAGWVNILAVITAARQAASHKKIAEQFVRTGKKFLKN